MSARSLMILGTASHAGKSIIAAAFCRILANEGYRVAPFKAQNMSLNSAATPDGCEIGRAQALQAEACRVPPSADMNPVLIKPSSDTGAQVVVMGRVWGQVTASEYHQKRVEELFPVVVEAHRRLAAEYDIVVMEGAGSPAEINLKARDIVNMRMAKAASAACLLVSDIDRGGMFASLLGTVELLDPDERALLSGFLVNKFRGDETLLQPGIDMIEARIGLRCAGVVHWLHDLGLDEEDGVALEERRTPQRYWYPLESGPSRRLRIGVVALPHMANFTDFDALAAEPSVALAYVDDPADLRHADLAILPGSKQTLQDLEWLRRRGFERELQTFAREPAKVGLLGICGGLQMLGRTIEDPSGAESGGSSEDADGLNLLPVATVLHSKKVTRMITGVVRIPHLFGQQMPHQAFDGYEIHLGNTVCLEGVEPFSDIRRSGETQTRADGAVSGKVCGTYVHGLFQRDTFRHAFVDAARTAAGLQPAAHHVFAMRERDSRIERLADHVRRSVDMDVLLRALGLHGARV